MSNKLPNSFNNHGLLPPGDYEATFNDLRSSLLVSGPIGKSAIWDTDWRALLVDNLEIMVNQLWTVGIQNIFVNGSFVENKDHPNDIDGYFECELRYLASGQLQQDLNLLDPNKIWTWNQRDRRLDYNSGKAQLPMWHFYRVELYAHYNQLSGIKDAFGHEQMFPAAFRKSRREHREKGVVKIIR